jgi:pimeloyl-[acyl-carrier protein] synthase
MVAESSNATSNQGGFNFGGINPAAPEFRANPYPIYHLLRGAMPVLKTPIGAWLISRYADGDAILVDKRFATIDLSRIGQAAQLGDAPVLQQAREVMGRTMLFMDPPRHGRIRGLVSKAFSPRMVESLRPRIQRIADDLLARFETRGKIDLIREFAYPLPVIVIAEMLGVPAEDRELFRRWITDLAPLIDFVQNLETVERAIDAMGQTRDYFIKLVDERRKRPAGDLVSTLIAAEERGDRLTLDEMLANIVLLLGAGHETTANLIGNGMYALLRNRGELERLRREPALIAGAIEECLRYDAPVQATGRRAVENVGMGGFTIPKGDHVIVLIGACNRDPVRFPEPDRFDITRADNDHLAFGGGIHNCLGANLARAEGQIAIGSLLARYPKIALGGDRIEYRDMFNLRGLKALPVTLT